jgi:hypothetical protein
MPPIMFLPQSRMVWQSRLLVRMSGCGPIAPTAEAFYHRRDVWHARPVADFLPVIASNRKAIA